MTFDEERSVETAISAAFERSGQSTDLIKLRAAVERADSPTVLWMILSRDKGLAKIAMRALIAWTKQGLQLPRDDSQPTRDAVKDGVVKPKTRAARREAESAEKVLAMKFAKVAHAKITTRALETFRLSDGALLCKRHWYELGWLKRNSEREAGIIGAVLALARPHSDKALVGDVITADQFDKILTQHCAPKSRKCDLPSLS